MGTKAQTTHTFKNVGERVAAPPAAERQPARNAHHRQVGRHAGMFEDAFAEHILKVGASGIKKAL